MRKLKKFELRTSQILSEEEMLKLNGGEVFVEKCTSATLGHPCITRIENLIYSGKCKSEYRYVTDGTSSYWSKTIFCDID